MLYLENFKNHNLKLLTEKIRLTEKGIKKVENLIEENGHRETAIKIVDDMLNRMAMMSSSDLPDSLTYSNGLDLIEQLLKDKEYQKAVETAKETAKDMLSEESEGMFESNKNNEDIKRRLNDAVEYLKYLNNSQLEKEANKLSKDIKNFIKKL